MKTMSKTTKRLSLKLALAAPLAAIGLAAAPHANAESILLAQTTLVVGNESTTDSFTTSGAGTVTVSLQSLNWPAQLDALSFSATSASQVLWNAGGQHVNSEIGSFNIDGAGTYFAHIMATAGGALDVGLYSLLMTFTPGTSSVPLPSSGWMLL